MDAYSWFRQKRQGRRFGRPNSAADIEIPLDPTPTVGFLVYYHQDAKEPLPDSEELLRLSDSYLKAHAPDTLRAAIAEFLSQGFIEPRVEVRNETMEPPDELIRAYNPGETEERRFRNATHVVFVGTADLLAPPRVGLWAAAAVARGIAASLPGGVLVDPEFPRVLPLSQLTEDLPGDGVIRIPEHILVPYSQDPRTGRLWMTTKGMDRFGLPDIEIRDVPPNLANSLTPVMNGIAQKLADAAMRHVNAATDALPEDEVEEVTGDEMPQTLLVAAEMDFSVADVRRAYAAPEEESEEDLLDIDDELLLTPEAPDARGFTRIRLEVTGGRRDEPTMLRVVPPGGERVSAGVWLNTLLTDLLGSEANLAMVERGDSQMEEAHRRAVAEVPYVRSRFQAGFRFGEVVHVKHGFPTESDGHEFMWIAVTAWSEDGRVRGHLANEPQYRADLKQGQTVEVKEDEIYDWLIVHADGETEGGYTNRVLQDKGDEETG